MSRKGRDRNLNWCDVRDKGGALVGRYAVDGDYLRVTNAKGIEKIHRVSIGSNDALANFILGQASGSEDRLDPDVSVGKTPINPVSGQRGRSYISVRCGGGCGRYLHLAECPPRASFDKIRDIETELTGSIVRCFICVKEVPVDGRGFILVELR